MSVVKTFLGNHRRKGYVEISRIFTQSMLTKQWDAKWHLIKIHFLHSYFGLFFRPDWAL